MPQKTHPLLVTDYPQVVFNQQTESPAAKKGERTRQSLIWACAHLLNQIGYQELRVSDICEVAEVSNAAFYIYFKNKVDITQVTLEDLSNHIFEALVSSTSEHNDNKTALYNSNLAWIKISRLNAGLMRCILQVSFINPEFAQLYDNLNYTFIRKATQNIAARANIPFENAEKLVFALSSMTDEYTRRLLSNVESPLNEIVKYQSTSDLDHAEFLSELWYKTIYT